LFWLKMLGVLVCAVGGSVKCGDKKNEVGR